MGDDPVLLLDRLVPAGLDAPTLRRARVVAVLSLLAAATIAAMAIPLSHLGDVGAGRPGDRWRSGCASPRSCCCAAATSSRRRGSRASP